MKKSTRIDMKKVFSVFLAIFCIALLPNLTISAQAEYTPSSAFASEVLLNNGVTYNLSALENYSANESVQIEMVEYKGTNVYYIYQSHYNPDIAVIIHEVNDIIHMPNESDYLTLNLRGLSIALAIPTAWDRVTIENEIATLKFDFEINLTDELIMFMDSQGYKNTGTGWSGDKLVNLQFSSGEVIISINCGEGGKTPDGKTIAEESIIWVEGPKNAINDTIIEDIKNMLEFLNIDSNEWDNADWETYSETIEDLMPIVNIDPETFDWSAAMSTELEWLVGEAIISGLSEAELKEISSKVEAGNAGYNSRLLYWDDNWMNFYETGGLLIRGDDWDTTVSQLDLNDLPNLGQKSSGIDAPSSGLLESNPGKKEDDHLFIWIALIITVMVILLLLLFIFKKKKLPQKIDKNIEIEPSIKRNQITQPPAGFRGPLAIIDSHQPYLTL